MSEKERITKLHGKQMQRLNVKSCMSLFLCAVLLFTSIDYTQAQAEETTNEAASVQAVTDSTVKDAGLNMDTGSENILVTADGMDTENKEGPATADGTDTENKEDTATADDTENDDNLATGDGVDKEDAADSNDDDKNSEDSGSSSEAEDTENPDGTNEDGTVGEDEGNSPTKNPDESDENDANKDIDDSSQEGEDTDEIQFEKTSEGAIIISSFEPLLEKDSQIILDKKLPLDDVTAMMPHTLKAYAYAYAATENKAGKDSVSDTASTAETQDGSEKEIILHELEIPVSWECNEDYNNTELESYNFTPNWDSAVYSYEITEAAGEEANAIPMITVTFNIKTEADTVSTQKELEEAFASGISKIVLAEDISLTSTMTLPASADILLDGQGFSLTRGTDENGVFTGTMIYMGGNDYTEKDYGRLTLTDICIDGNVPDNHVGSSAIIDYGSLTLDKDAYIKNNSSYGTYDYDADGKLQTLINDFGGGVQVYGELKVTERALITGNFADEFGGGVYLADNSVLYLYADVIKENSVAKDTGYGEDLYADNGSTIYYDSSIDMEREGFYICAGVKLICLQGIDEEVEMALFDDENVEFYVSVAGESGYNVEEIENRLAALGEKYSVVSKRTDIDVTDLGSWYVYDHYDTNKNCWEDLTTDNDANGKPDTWEAYYGYNPNRGYYPCTESYIYSGYRQYQHDDEGNYVKDADGNYIYADFPVEKPAYTIADWMAGSEYIRNGCTYLSAFKEHIYQGRQDGYPMMTFAGYGHPAYVDFMFYDPQSNGEKVVDFDIDSSKVNDHTLAGAGFLVNTAVKNGDMYGYLVYYDYTGSDGTYPSSLSIYYLNGINAEEFHNGTYDLKTADGKDILGLPLPDATYIINPSNWKNEMSVQIKITTNSIEIRQQPKDASTSIALSKPVLSIETDESDYSGFGPLVAYTSVDHTCNQASSFTYSNLSMYYTNPIQEGQSILHELEKADYTQEGTQKYFINLFGDSELDYNNEDVETWMYQDYLKLMQLEGVALITDRDTSFEEYLGESGEAGSNLCEVRKGATVDELINLIKEYVDKQKTTHMQNKLQSDENSDGLKNAEPGQPVGNCWLKAESGNRQVKTLWGDTLPDSGYTIQIIDDISYYHDGSDITGVTYEISKPGASAYTTVSTTTPYETASFVVGNEASEWPAGQYSVRQTIHTSKGDANVHGYAYFEIKRNDDPEHTHMWSEWTVDVVPTCTTTGYRYRYCETCEALVEETIPATGHKSDNKFSYDETDHWYTCSLCSEKLDLSHHEFGNEDGGWIIDIPATEGADGRKHRECNVCKRIEQDIIKLGKVTKREDCGKNAPHTVISTELKALAWAALENEDIQEVKGGQDIDIVLTVDYAGNTINNTISASDRTAITSIMDSYKLGQYLDVNLYKKINSSESRIDETKNKIRLVFDVPVRLKKISSKLSRSFVIIRVHDGKAVILNDLDSDDNTITIDTDCFSTYAIAYADNESVKPDKTDNTTVNSGSNSNKLYNNRPNSNKLNSNQKKNSTNKFINASKTSAAAKKDGEPKTGNPSHVNLYATIALIEGLSYLMNLFTFRCGMTEEKKNELIARLIEWAKQGGRLRKAIAIVSIFMLLVYYHSIGKHANIEWSQVYN